MLRQRVVLGLRWVGEFKEVQMPVYTSTMLGRSFNLGDAFRASTLEPIVDQGFYNKQAFGASDAVMYDKIEVSCTFVKDASLIEAQTNFFFKASARLLFFKASADVKTSILTERSDKDLYFHIHYHHISSTERTSLCLSPSGKAEFFRLKHSMRHEDDLSSVVDVFGSEVVIGLQRGKILDVSLRFRFSNDEQYQSAKAEFGLNAGAGLCGFSVTGGISSEKRSVLSHATCEIEIHTKGVSGALIDASVMAIKNKFTIEGDVGTGFELLVELLRIVKIEPVAVGEPIVYQTASVASIPDILEGWSAFNHAVRRDCRLAEFIDRQHSVLVDLRRRAESLVEHPVQLVHIESLRQLIRNPSYPERLKEKILMHRLGMLDDVLAGAVPVDVPLLCDFVVAVPLAIQNQIAAEIEVLDKEGKIFWQKSTHGVEEYKESDDVILIQLYKTDTLLQQVKEIVRYFNSHRYEVDATKWECLLLKMEPVSNDMITASLVRDIKDGVAKINDKLKYEKDLSEKVQLQFYRKRFEEMRGFLMQAKQLLRLDDFRDVEQEIRRDVIFLQKEIDFEWVKFQWPVPPTVVNQFREALLYDISEKFIELDAFDVKMKFLVLQGIGGVGKTTLLDQYLFRHQKDYDFILYFHAANLDQLKEQFRVFLSASPRNIIPVDDKDLFKQMAVWLEKQSRGLIIFDNVDVDYKTFEPFLCGTVKHHILISSRNVHWPMDSQLSVPERMELDVAEALVCQILASVCEGQKERIKELLGALYYFPLAIVHACGYMLEMAISIEQFLEDYKISRECFKVDNIPAGLPKHIPLWITYDMNINKLVEKLEGQINFDVFMHYLCLNPSGTIKRRIFDYLSVFVFLTPFDSPAEYRMRINKLFGSFVSIGLMKVDLLKDEVSIHPLVFEIFNKKYPMSMTIRVQRLNELANAIFTTFQGEMFKKDQMFDGFLDVWAALAQHVELQFAQLGSNFEVLVGVSVKALMRMKHIQAWSLWYKGALTQLLMAKSYLDESYKFYTPVLVAEQLEPEYAVRDILYGLVLRDHKDIRRSELVLGEDKFNQVISRYSESIDPFHQMLVGVAMQALGSLYYYRSNTLLAQEYSRKAFKRVLSGLGEKHYFSLATMLNSGLGTDVNNSSRDLYFKIVDCLKLSDGAYREIRIAFLAYSNLFFLRCYDLGVRESEVVYQYEHLAFKKYGRESPSYVNVLECIVAYHLKMSQKDLAIEFFVRIAAVCQVMNHHDCAIQEVVALARLFELVTDEEKKKAYFEQAVGRMNFHLSALGFKLTGMSSFCETFVKVVSRGEGGIILLPPLLHNLSVISDDFKLKIFSELRKLIDEELIQSCLAESKELTVAVIEALYDLLGMPHSIDLKEHYAAFLGIFCKNPKISKCILSKEGLAIRLMEKLQELLKFKTDNTRYIFTLSGAVCNLLVDNDVHCQISEHGELCRSLMQGLLDLLSSSSLGNVVKESVVLTVGNLVNHFMVCMHIARDLDLVLALVMQLKQLIEFGKIASDRRHRVINVFYCLFQNETIRKHVLEKSDLAVALSASLRFFLGAEKMSDEGLKDRLEWMIRWLPNPATETVVVASVFAGVEVDWVKEVLSFVPK